jgi:hypothetical protein
MKELRARGIKKLIRQLQHDCKHLEGLSRDDVALGVNLEGARDHLDRAADRVQELLEERTSA